MDSTKVIINSKPIIKRIVSPAERVIRNDNGQPLSKSVKMEDLRKYFHLPIVEVARQLGTCTTALKKICRKNNISKWPYRQIRSITKSIQSLEMASLNDTLSEELRIQYRQQIVTLQNAIDDLIKDPNSIVQLVNMGLSEEALQNLRESNAAAFGMSAVGGGVGIGGMGFQDDEDELDGVSSSLLQNESHLHSNYNSNNMLSSSSNNMASAGGSLARQGSGYMLPSAGNGGATGVLNLLQWPKPSADVQQILQAAAQLTTSNEGTSSTSRGKATAKSLKRKAGELGEDPTATSLPAGSESNTAEGSNTGPQYFSTDGVLDVSQLEGGNLRHKKVEIGETLAECAFVSEAQRMVFSGPIHLAPLQRKKLRPNITRKVVPLMEPDIGSNFGIEFIPQFILAILHTAISSGSTGSAQNSPDEMRQQHDHMPQQQEQQRTTSPPLDSNHHNNNDNHNSSNTGSSSLHGGGTTTEQGGAVAHSYPSSGSLSLQQQQQGGAQPLQAITAAASASSPSAPSVDSNHHYSSTSNGSDSCSSNGHHTEAYTAATSSHLAGSLATSEHHNRGFVQSS